MSRQFRVLMSVFAAIAITLMFATPDPEIGGDPVSNPVVLTIIFIATMVVSLRLWKVINDMQS